MLEGLREYGTVIKSLRKIVENKFIIPISMGSNMHTSMPRKRCLSLIIFFLDDL